MNEQQRIEEQEIRELISAAGPRPGPPAEDVQRIRTAAREEWRRMVGRRERCRRGLRLRGGLALAVSVLLALVLVWWWASRTASVAAPVVAGVELVHGAARADGAGLAVGGELAAGARVETAAAGSAPPAGLSLRLSGGQSLRLAAGTRVRLVSARRFELEEGVLYVDSSVSAAPGGVEVVTALGTVRDVGTQFEVRLREADAVLRVRVREGECSVATGGERHRATRGEELRLGRDGSLRRAAVAPYGPEWDWVVATAPVIEMDGRSLATVLDWVERETGRSIRFADPALEASAQTSVLRGSSAGFTLEETLATAVRSSGFAYRVENGTILLSR